MVGRDTKRKVLKIFLPLFIVLFSLAVSFLLFSFYSRLSFEKTLSVILRNLFPDPATNGFYGQDSSVYVMLYLSVLFALGISMFVGRFSQRRSGPNEGEARGYTHNFFHLFVGFLGIIALAQLLEHGRYFDGLNKRFSGKIIEEKQAVMFGFPFVFAQNCRGHLKGFHTGKLITDLDIRRSFEMTAHRRLAYYLYPISIRYPKEGERPDCLVFFYKKDALKHIPDDFVLRYKFDDNNMLAVRRK